MLAFETGEHTDCDGVSRRDLLRIGGLGAFGLTLPGLLQAQAHAATNGKKVKDVSCILLWMGGGHE